MTGRFELGGAEWQALAYEGGQTMTRNAAVWEFLERYHEFLVNGLDLVSFLLVTPEAVLLVRPLIRGKSGIGMLRFSTAIFTAYVSMFAGNTFLMYLTTEASFLAYVARFFPFLAGAFVGITFGFWKNKLLSLDLRRRFSNLSSINFLFVGVALFFIARMLALPWRLMERLGFPDGPFANCGGAPGSEARAR